MKILLIGALNSNHTKRWANAMATRGHDVLVAHRPDQKDDMGDLHPNVKTAALKYGGKASNCVKKEILMDTEEHVFENLQCSIPKEYDTYLTQIYGDYMTPKKY